MCSPIRTAITYTSGMQQTLTLLGERTAETFLRDYWQKRPLLIRGALPDFDCPISPDELAGLACEEEVESRLVLEHAGPGPWSVEHGPIEETRFGELPETHWTLLVQECNRYVPELAKLLEQFSFIPRWRVDDIMASYAPAQGSVGPHTDQYDVFLIQALGTRRWQISEGPVDAGNQLPDLDLCIMRDFRPSEEWIVRPGDMLYLPPGVAHYGVALEDCITLSVGFRAPSHAELLSGFADHVAARLDAAQRYTDPDLQLQKSPAEISPAALHQVREILRGMLADDKAINYWFGEFITEAKHSQQLANDPHCEETSTRQFLQDFAQAGELFRNDELRFAFMDEDNGASLFIDGQAFPLNNELAFVAPLLCGQPSVNYSQLETALQQSDFAELLTSLYNQNHVYFENV